MHFSSTSHLFSSSSKLSDLEEDLALFEAQSSQILRRHFKENTTLTYSCQDKKKLHCPFSLTYEIREDETGVEWAYLQPERTNLTHSHISMKKCSEMDFESMRRCFKVLEPHISQIIMGNYSTAPMEIMEDLILGSHLTDAMKKLQTRYPKRFKKCLDNQTNKIKRKMKKMGLSTTIQASSKSFLSFFSEQTEKTLNFLIKDDSEGKEDDETKIIQACEDEKNEEPLDDTFSILSSFDNEQNFFHFVKE